MQQNENCCVSNLKPDAKVFSKMLKEVSNCTSKVWHKVNYQIQSCESKLLQSEWMLLCNYKRYLFMVLDKYAMCNAVQVIKCYIQESAVATATKTWSRKSLSICEISINS